MKHKHILSLCEAAIMLAIATVLSYLELWHLPQGGAVCIGALPIFLYASRWGFKKGVLCGLAYGILQFFFDGEYAIGWVSIILDFILAFTVLGVGGIFAKKKFGIFYGTVLGSFLRFVCHFISGITVFRMTTPTVLFNTTFTNPYLYSLAYNGSYVFLNMLVCLVIFALLYKPLGKYMSFQDLKAE